MKSLFMQGIRRSPIIARRLIMSTDNTRKVYKFIAFGEMNTASGQPVYSNTLQLNLDAIKWFASNTMATIYVKNNTTRQMRKFSVNPDRKLEFGLDVESPNNTDQIIFLNKII